MRGVSPHFVSVTKRFVYTGVPSSPRSKAAQAAFFKRGGNPAAFFIYAKARR